MKSMLLVRLLLVLAAVAVMAVAVLTFAEAEVADPDLWGAMAMGRETLAHHWPPTHDPFAFVPTKNPVVYHEWLSGLLFYLLLMSFGSTILKILSILAGLATAAFATLTARRLGASYLALLVVLMVALPALQQGYSVIRSQVFTFLFFSLFLLLLEGAASGHRRFLLIIPPVTIVWANLHGGFLAGIGLLILYMVAGFVRHERPWLLVGIAVLAVLGTLMNPYGIAYWHYLRDALLMPRPRIGEWNPVPLDLFSRWQFKVLLLLSFAIFVTARRRHWTGIVVMTVTALVAARHLRHIPFFAIAAMAFLPTPLTPLLDRLVAAMRTRIDRSQVPATVGTSFMLFWLAIAAIFQLVRFVPWQLQVPASFYPVGAVEFLRLNDLRGNLVTPFNWGEYVLWKLYPRVKVSFDGRYETVYPSQVAADSFNFAHGVGDWRRLLREYPSDMVLVDKTYNMARLMDEEPGWQAVYDDAISRLYLRAPARSGPWLLPAGRDGTIP